MVFEISSLPQKFRSVWFFCYFLWFDFSLNLVCIIAIFIGQDGFFQDSAF